ncbi:MAG: NAD-dependent epimerase/dehydratase family protein [Candidatus Hodarchaeota archaeon]
MKYKISIIGGAGFIGRSLSKHLAEKFIIKVLDIKPLPESLKGIVNHVYSDIRNYEEISSELEDVDLVIHTAIIQIPLINENKLLGYEINVVGTQNVCRAVEENPNIKGMILAGTWHTVGEQGLRGVIDEEFGFRPDKVEERARLYALSKIAQESVVRFYDEMSEKIFGIIRMGTVLGEEMPEKTAANIFIERGLKNEPITPYKHSMYRPMLYVDISDICRAFEAFVFKILYDDIKKPDSSLEHIVNVCYPEPITIFELAEIVRECIIENTKGKIKPNIEIIDKDTPIMFMKDDKNNIKVNINKAKILFGLTNLKSPKASINEIIHTRVENSKT